MYTLSTKDIESLANREFITRVDSAEKILEKCSDLDALKDQKYITQVVRNSDLMTAIIYDSIEDDLVQPENEDNTPEQQEMAQEASVAFTNKSTKDFVADEPINNITVPSNAVSYCTLSGEFQDGAQITNESSKSITLNNTGDPTTISVHADNTYFVLKGEYDEVYSNTGIGSGTTAVLHKVVIDSDTQRTQTPVYGNFADGCKIYNISGSSMSIGNVSDDEPSVTLYAPNSTCTADGKYNEFNVTTADNTLKLLNTFHAKKLIVNKGNVICDGPYTDEFFDELELIDGSISVSGIEENANASNLNKAGIKNFVENISVAKPIQITTGAHIVYNLNGYDLSIAGSDSRGAIFKSKGGKLDIYGPGRVLNTNQNYGIWLYNEDAELNIYGGYFEATTHVLYSEKGTINIYGGEFKMNGGSDKDIHGNWKFLLNCLDASWSAGTAKINVYGGKFHWFNPAEAYSEPGSPVSYVPEGYHVVMTEEGDDRIYEVLPD